MFSLEKSWFQGNLTALCQCPGRAKLFTAVYGGKATDDRSEIKQGKFRLDIERNLFRVRMSDSGAVFPKILWRFSRPVPIKPSATLSHLITECGLSRRLNWRSHFHLELYCHHMNSQL